MGGRTVKELAILTGHLNAVVVVLEHPTQYSFVSASQDAVIQWPEGFAGDTMAKNQFNMHLDFA
jgi:hypothetical protein